jgi:hypothetical protein
LIFLLLKISTLCELELGDGDLASPTNCSISSPPVSQLAARLSQPLAAAASSNQLRSLLQRPIGGASTSSSSSAIAAESGNIVLTHSASSPMVGGTPVSTTRVWVPGI